MVDKSVEIFDSLLDSAISNASDEDAKEVFKTAVNLLTSNSANSDD